MAHLGLARTSNSAVRRHDFEQVIPEVTIDRFGSKPLLIEPARGLFPPLQGLPVSQNFKQQVSVRLTNSGQSTGNRSRYR